MRSQRLNYFDIVIIGGGHAGVEAAWAAAHMLAGRGTVALVSMDPNAIGRMSCNPAIGGLAKGQMVREIDALGGLMGHAIDAAGIQFRMLNKSKGPAVQSPRAQADKYAYARAVQQLLREHCPNLTVVSGIADRLLVEPLSALEATTQPAARRIAGVALESGETLHCRCAIVTTGTFLRGLMHTGEAKTEGGRVGEQSSRGMSACLEALGFELGRLKTGTPPRVARETVDFSALEQQPGDAVPVPFSDLTGTPDAPLARQFPLLSQSPCWITYTNEPIHALIRENLHRAPMYSGQIHGRGPRYCPSLEDKVVRFADKPQHQVFLEPESLDTNEIYCNGISTSLPTDVQERIVHGISGLEHARILKWGYAVEYDFCPTHQISATLETRRVAGLFLAGQINGTSGYEEAAGQGLVAGINAARRIRDEGPFTLRRDQAYIGVMIDDLITKTPTEPYRMFTSRAEFRLTLRSDNTDQRLTQTGYELGLATRPRLERLQAKLAAMTAAMQTLRTCRTTEGVCAYDLLRRPDVAWEELSSRINSPQLRAMFAEPTICAVMPDVQIQARYAGYIGREKRSAAHLHALEDKILPANINFAAMVELRKEAREALNKFHPGTLGQASRLEGLTPSDLTILMMYVSGRKRATAQ